MTLQHPVFARWSVRHPDRLQLFSLPTPNGVKVSIMLEETGIAYEAHRVDIMANENQEPAFVSLNPNGKIPAIFDPSGPAGQPVATRVYRAGEDWSEPPGAIHSISRNASSTESARLLAVFVLDTDDKTLTTPVK